MSSAGGDGEEEAPSNISLSQTRSELQNLRDQVSQLESDLQRTQNILREVLKIVDGVNSRVSETSDSVSTVAERSEKTRWAMHRQSNRIEDLHSRVTELAVRLENNNDEQD